jgi:hypothetical protein
MSLQEKFQIVTPYSKKEDDGDKWASQASQRVLYQGKPENTEQGLNDTYDCASPRDNFVRGFGGDTDVSDDVGASSMKNGFKRLDHSGADDQYTGEHVDLFYGEAVDENGKAGFVERNNYLDRL